MQDLTQDIIGTNPSFPKLVNHGWLTVDPKTYDNYPSDNNSVRIGPKLAEIWNHESKGLNLIPNLTVQQLGANASNKEATEGAIADVVREAKKAMMAGISGKELADHIRSRFHSNDIVLAKDSLAKLSEEQGLLGNVYIDASAFTTPKEAEQFLTQHRTRLAQDIILNESKLTKEVVGFLANKFHKNVLASVKYDENTFDKYKNHLVASGKISKSFVINSKETLRDAFMAVPEKVEVAAKKVEKVDPDKALKDIMEKSAQKAFVNKWANEEILFKNALPILDFARSQVVKGKSANDLKEMLRKKYAAVDLKDASKYIAFVVAELNGLPGLTPEKVDKLVEAGEISEFIADGLKKLARKYTMKQQVYAETQNSERQVGVKGTLYSLSGSKISDEFEPYRTASVEALRKGIEVDKIRVKLMNKLSMEQADKILSDSMVLFNASPVGIKANVAVKKPKEKVVPDLPEKETLPDPSTIEKQSQEVLSFFEGCEGMVVDVDPSSTQKTLDVGGLISHSGLDSIM